MYDYELYHHGVKGMKWGVRRTKAQLGHKVKKTLKKAGKALSKTVAEQKAKRAAKIAKNRPKRIEDMSDQELKDRIARLELEASYKRLSPQRVSRGQAFVSSFLENAFIPASEDVGKQLVKSGMVGVLNKALNLPDDLKLYTNNKKK